MATQDGQGVASGSDSLRPPEPKATGSNPVSRDPQHPVTTEERSTPSGGQAGGAGSPPQSFPNGSAPADALAAIRARHGVATQGPYRWRGYATNHTISLDSVATGNEVLGFRRWGMTRAQPVFCTDGLLCPASEVLAPDSNPSRKRIIAILHPDAEALAHSWSDVETLLRLVDQQAAELAALRRAGPVPCAYCGKPAVCIGGGAEGHEPENTPACDVCCGHGNEDGHCCPLSEVRP